MNRTLVIGVDPDKDTPAFASVMIEEDLSTKVVFCGVAENEMLVLGRVCQFTRTELDLESIETRIFIESPEAVYARGRGIRIQDIVELARTAGAIAGSFATMGMGPIDYVTPAEWKGQVPKDISQARTCSRLGWGYQRKGGKKGYCIPSGVTHFPAGVESLKGSDWKHVLDAIGIALWGADTIVSIEKRRQAMERANLRAP
mgnify:CR=1 FL=1